ncbi:GNAT family N-acetyltransferase [Yoonia sp. GPGPB17]|uniref:GNAT family N-acetyltransferase n=1 Tax=Yoonia sp. GPGPB17 TaxID=3026147 RepID=UPI0030C19C0C
MTNPTISIVVLSPSDIETHLADLTRVIRDSVLDGAAISFMATLTDAEAQRFWNDDVRSGLEFGSRLLFGALVDGRLVGTVQLVVGMPPNQPHRAETSKMVVHPESRRLGLGKALMTAALEAAERSNKTLVTLDTRTGDVAGALYRSVGFEKAGVIPDFAYDPDGQARHATTYMYRYL